VNWDGLPGGRRVVRLLETSVWQEDAGRAFSFLYAWQLLISAPTFRLPRVASDFRSTCLSFCRMRTALSRPRRCLFSLVLSGQTLIARLLCGVAIAVSLPQQSLHQSHRALAGLVVGMTLVLIIIAGFTPKLIARLNPGVSSQWGVLCGLGAGMLSRRYDYWGYYNVCFLGAEVRDPQRTIPALCWERSGWSERFTC